MPISRSPIQIQQDPAEVREPSTSNNDVPDDENAQRRDSFESSFSDLEICDTLTVPRVGAVNSCRLPPFWKSNPELWFFQVEATFGINKIRSDDSKYNLVLSKLDQDSLQEVADIVKSPPNSGKYKNLKEAILRRLVDTTDHQLHKLLTQLELGDKKPSQLLHRMKALAGDRVSDELLRVKWLDLLPGNVQRPLRIFKAADLEELSIAADELMVSSPTITSISAVNSYVRARSPTRRSHSPFMPTTSRNEFMTSLTSISTSLTHLIELNRQILDKVSGQSSGNSNQRWNDRGRSPARTRSPKPLAVGYCFFHRRYGMDAHKCEQPCSFKPMVSQAGQSEN